MALNAIDLSLQNSGLMYTGRIAWEDPAHPVFIWPATSLEFNFRGDEIILTSQNHNYCWINYIGFVIDGKPMKLKLNNEGETVTKVPLEDGEHRVILYKPSDNYEVTLISLEISGELLAPPKRPGLSMEVYGDSVSAGEVCEAALYLASEDPDHNGEYNNSWHSWCWQCARSLGASLHDIAQGGIPLMAGTGWWHEPDFYGMEEIWDKVHYNPSLHAPTTWDFSLYTPDIVAVAIGQNDSNPDDFMKNDPSGEKAANWKRHYSAFLSALREKYPNAHIICMMTILSHAMEWDEAIDEVVRGLGDSRTTHFMFRRNGCGTPGHPRIPEQTEMAREIAEYIKTLI